jgi:phosphoribosylamine---glycine ligase|tara:strand:- start:689 stop:1960 length:1272 start_codon:yes stop_codon:yes gene_type:complete
MKVGIIGSGGREHALCHFIQKSKKVSKIYCFPGNAGTSEIAENINIDIQNFDEIKNKVTEHKIDYLIIGPEKPLVDGIVDFLEKHNIKTFGPNRIAAKLEGSKIFTKKLCKKYQIPTANFGIFKNSKDTLSFLEKTNFPIVIKADGLAAGKGVYICKDLKTATQGVNEIFDGKFGIANEILVEEFLVGEEMSYFIISDGLNYKKFQTAQDHKRVFEGDQGPNTGGMGAYCPSKLINEDLDKKIINRIIEPTLKGLKDMNTNFRGFLYAGLMIKDNEPFLIEYNVRMGDPECQTILPKLNNDLMEVIKACINNKLDSVNLSWNNNQSLCVVLCSKGYPDKFEKNVEIKNLSKLKLEKSNDEFIFHAGTQAKNEKIFSNGGRVLNFVKQSENYKKSREDIIKLIQSLNWVNGFYRKDIGYKVIDK